MPYEPKVFEEFVGQYAIKRELLAMLAAKSTRPILLRGNFGSGKTTLAKIYGIYRGDYTYQEVPDVLTGLNSSVKTHIIDEIHLAGKFELLYPQMRDQAFVFCTTERQALPAPFVSRCIELVMGDYLDSDLEQIVTQYASREGIVLDPNAVKIIASRSRSTPRTATILVDRLKNLAILEGASMTARFVASTLDSLRVYPNGLMQDDINYLTALAESGSPVSLRALSSILNRDESYIQENVESFLLYKRLISITPRGRIITEHGHYIIEETYGIRN